MREGKEGSEKVSAQRSTQISTRLALHATNADKLRTQIQLSHTVSVTRKEEKKPSSYTLSHGMWLSGGTGGKRKREKRSETSTYG